MQSQIPNAGDLDCPINASAHDYAIAKQAWEISLEGGNSIPDVAWSSCAPRSDIPPALLADIGHEDAPGVMSSHLQETSVLTPAAANEPDGRIQLTDAELADPEYMRGYVEGCHDTVDELIAENRRLKAALAAQAHHSFPAGDIPNPVAEVQLYLRSGLGVRWLGRCLRPRIGTPLYTIPASALQDGEEELAVAAKSAIYAKRYLWLTGGWTREELAEADAKGIQPADKPQLAVWGQLASWYYPREDIDQIIDTAMATSRHEEDT